MGSEIIQFVLALVLFAIILIGSYWFVVYAPKPKRNSPWNHDDGRSGPRG